MKFNTKKIIAALTAVSLILSGCTPKNNNSSEDNSSKKVSTDSVSSSVNTNASAYGAQISVADIKSLYEEADSNSDIMPLNNVASDESFDFNFKINFQDTDVFQDVVTVHTDRNCLDESKLYVFENIDENGEGGSKVTISPCEAVLGTDSEDKAEMNNDKYSWGQASIYYLAIHYDMDADTLVHLDKPIIIPFTVKKEIPAPEVRGVVDNTGRFKLVWDPVEGATQYNIYSLSKGDEVTGENNPPINGALTGYHDSYLTLYSTTSETEFDNFAGEDHGLAVDRNGYVMGQNYCVNGDYYVSAVIGDKESGFSAGVETAGLILPYKPTDDCDIMFKDYDSVADLPLTLDIINIDGSVTARNVLYTFQWGSTEPENSMPQYKYRVEGTALTGYVDMKDNLSEYPETVGNASPAGNEAPEDNVPKTPDPDVNTIITPEDINSGNPATDQTEPAQTEETKIDKDDSSDAEITKKKDDSSEKETTKEKDESSEPENTKEKDESSSSKTDPHKDDSSSAGSSDGQTLVEQQQENTQNHIDAGNSHTVDNTDESYLVFADSAAEEWFARNMINVQTEFSIEAFPEMQDPNLLVDTLQKVIYQNPYILGVKSYGYDYNTLTVSIEYTYDAQTTKQKQSEIASEASSIISKAVTDNMSDEEKRMAIYNYLEENCKYDDAALEDAENNGFQITDDNKFADAFNTYGIIVKKVGVCQSYANAYKLLCQMSGVDCIVITGFLNGNLPHAWNAVKIDDKWFMTDTTNNGKTSGIPYMLYNADTDTTMQSGFTTNTTFDLDSNLGTYNTDDDEFEYYYTNKQVADDLDSYSEILDRILTADSKTVCVRYIGQTADTQELANAVLTVYNKHGMEDQLKTLGLAQPNGFILLMQTENDNQ